MIHSGTMYFFIVCNVLECKASKKKEDALVKYIHADGLTGNAVHDITMYIYILYDINCIICIRDMSRQGFMLYNNIYAWFVYNSYTIVVNFFVCS